jgi:hypothetical protein
VVYDVGMFLPQSTLLCYRAHDLCWRDLRSERTLI